MSPGSYVTRTAPINLTPTNFLNQSFGDPQVTYGDNGEWFITGYGDHDLGDQSFSVRPMALSKGQPGQR